MQQPLTNDWLCDVLRISYVHGIKEKDEKLIIINSDPRNNSEG